MKHSFVCYKLLKGNSRHVCCFLLNEVFTNTNCYNFDNDLNSNTPIIILFIWKSIHLHRRQLRKSEHQSDVLWYEKQPFKVSYWKRRISKSIQIILRKQYHTGLSMCSLEVQWTAKCHELCLPALTYCREHFMFSYI